MRYYFKKGLAICLMLAMVITYFEPAIKGKAEEKLDEVPVTMTYTMYEGERVEFSMRLSEELYSNNNEFVLESENNEIIKFEGDTIVRRYGKGDYFINYAVCDAVALKIGECRIALVDENQEVLCYALVRIIENKEKEEQELPVQEGGTTTPVIKYPEGSAFETWRDDTIILNCSTTEEAYIGEQEGNIQIIVDDINDSKNFIIETFNSNFERIDSKKIHKEIYEDSSEDIYLGEKYNYIIYGKENLEEKEDAEVIRIVQYNKKWEWVSEDSLYGANTIYPFKSSNISYAEHNGNLYVKTAHQMFKADDGLNHQASMAIVFNAEQGKIVDSATEVNRFPYGYVAHSFAQYVQFEDDMYFSIDHGDAYPRAIVLTKNRAIGTDGALQEEPSEREILQIPGLLGENYTGISVGGYEISKTHHLVAISTAYMKDGIVAQEGTRNIQILALRKGDEEEGEVKKISITNYVPADDHQVGQPYMIEITNNRYMLLWQEVKFDPENKWYKDREYRVFYTLIDGDGNQLCENKSFEGAIGGVKPIFYNGRVVWYAARNDKFLFYNLPIDGSSVDIKEKFPFYEEDIEEKPTKKEQNPPKKKDIFTDKQTTYKYRITKLKEDGSKYNEASYIMGKKSKDKKIVVPAKILVDGTYYRITTIDYKAFAHDSKVEKIIIPNTVTKLGRRLFKDSTNLKEITISTAKLKKNSFEKDTFFGMADNVTIYVPKNKLKTYKKWIRELVGNKKIKIKGK